MGAIRLGRLPPACYDIDIIVRLVGELYGARIGDKDWVDGGLGQSALKNDICNCAFVDTHSLTLLFRYSFLFLFVCCLGNFFLIKSESVSVTV